MSCGICFDLVIWDAEFDVGIHFKILPEKVNTRSNYVKKSNFPICFCLQKQAYLIQFCLRIQKMSFFDVRLLEMPKIAFQKVTSPHLPFLPWTMDNDIALKFVCFCLYVVL